MIEQEIDMCKSSVTPGTPGITELFLSAGSGRVFRNNVRINVHGCSCSARENYMKGITYEQITFGNDCRPASDNFAAFRLHSGG
jgi:hypothetical protein